MAELKTRQTRQSVSAFLESIADKKRRAECRTLARMMRAATGCPARMWGTSIVGFGAYDYRCASGRKGSWPLVGFSPRKQNLTLYIMPGFSRFDRLMSELGKYKTGKSCLYVKSLDDVDQNKLRMLIDGSVKYMKHKYAVA
jgi:Domain of unknown function (DU1801)